ncbi:hypothetical protein ACROYT_G032931 [Oculina patagonica]
MFHGWRCYFAELLLKRLKQPTVLAGEITGEREARFCRAIFVCNEPKELQLANDKFSFGFTKGTNVNKLNEVMAMEYTEEQLNYYRICYVTTDILTEELRTIFKQEWDSRYKATKGEWKDESRNGMDFYNGESPKNKTRNARLLATMINGNRAEWDCTMLFYAILYSDCIHGLNPVVKSNVDDLRRFRNEEFAHMPKGNLSDPDFQIAIGKVCAAFQALGLSTQIQDIRNQRSFPTKELNDVLKKVDDLKQEIQEKEKDLQEKGKELQEKGKELQEKEDQRQVLEDQLHNEISSFCILPPKPSHDVAGRDCEVDKITRKLKQLKGANESRLSHLYLSGNPGSGKSQLAGLVAKRFFDEVKEIPSATSFVMTVNAESPDTLLESYVSFARHLKCPEYAVTNTRNSEDLKTDERITSLKTLISTKIELYTTWLLVVDNVSSISRVSVHLPESGNEQFAKGQFLITTQDNTSIPSANPFTQHISVSKGMDPHDASNLLAKLSGITDSEMENKVAQALDFQPLALASAAAYVREAREGNLTFDWKDYLKKLEEGQRVTTETRLTEINEAAYPRSMTAATTLAVKKVMESNKVIHHTFSFLSLCTPQPLCLDIIINYILNVDEAIQDKETISAKIRNCSLLLVEKEESGIYIREHQIVHDVINTVMKDCQADKLLEAVDGALRSFKQYIDLQNEEPHFDSFVNSNHIVPHLTALINTIEKLSCEQDIHQVVQGSSINYPRYFQRLGKMCESDCAFDTAKKYFDLELEFIEHCDVSSDEDLAEANFDLGRIHLALNNFPQAKKHWENQRDILKERHGTKHVDVASAYTNLGTVHSYLSEQEQAIEYHECALHIFKETLGPEHVDVARTCGNLGTAYSYLGDMKQAKECHERALAIFLERPKPEHVDVARSYSNLGTVCRALGELEQAKEYHERALDIRLKRLGPEHVDVARSYSSLGTVYSCLCYTEQAKKYHELALDILLKRLVHDHVQVALTYSNLGTVYSKLGDLEQGKEYHELALDILLKRLGPEHIDIARTYNDLGAVLRNLDDLEKAKEYHECALGIFLKRLEPGHVHVATTLDYLAAVHRDLGDLEKAKECDACTLAIRQKRPDLSRLMSQLLSKNKKSE